MDEQTGAAEREDKSSMQEDRIEKKKERKIIALNDACVKLYLDKIQRERKKWGAEALRLETHLLNVYGEEERQKKNH